MFLAFNRVEKQNKAKNKKKNNNNNNNNNNFQVLITFLT